MKTIENLGNIVSKYMAGLIVLVSIVAFYSPQTFEWGIPNMGKFLSIMMFGVGLSIKSEQFKFVLKRPKDMFIGAIGQFTIMPLVAFILSKLLQLPMELTLGLIILGSCPGGISSNVMTFISKGDIALSISLTTISTLLAPIATPILILVFANSQIDVSLGSMVTSIVQTIIIPIILAAIINKFLPKISEVMTKILPLLSSILLMLLTSASISSSVETLKTSGITIVIAVILHHIIGHLLGYFLAYKCGCDEIKRRAICIEVGMQNSGLATTLAFAHFNPTVAVACAISGPLQTVLDAMLANYWGKKETDIEILPTNVNV